jgi:hypothetical protein
VKVKQKFSKKELAYLAEVYPQMLDDGDSHTTNLDRFLMKKVGVATLACLIEAVQVLCGTYRLRLRCIPVQYKDAFCTIVNRARHSWTASS